MSLKGKLNRMKKHLSHNQTEKRQETKEEQTQPVTAENIPFLKSGSNWVQLLTTLRTLSV